MNRAEFLKLCILGAVALKLTPMSLKESTKQGLRFEYRVNDGPWKVYYSGTVEEHEDYRVISYAFPEDLVLHNNDTLQLRTTE